jgi:hypothetical protein
MLFLLKNICEDSCNSFDYNRAMIIRASSEKHAREIASRESLGDDSVTWLDSVYSTCEAIDPNGPPEVIYIDTLEA